jgi:PAS domain S-box-containing protein
MAFPCAEPFGEPLLELKNIDFYYDTLKVLKDINLKIQRSEVHAIVGEHGAGKTSLCLIMSGFLKPHSGKIIIGRRVLDCLSLKKARTIGIEIVSQQNPVVDNFTVAENLFIDNRGIAPHPFINHKRHLEVAQAYLRECDFPLKPNALLRNMKLSDRVLVDILKHLFNKPRLLILDEALQKLTAPVMNKMIQILKELKQAGMSIIFVTHRIDDIYNFADKVSIIKNGEILITDSVKNIDKINLIKLAYTQISGNESLENANQEFYSLLKYNEAVLIKLPVNLIVVDHHGKIKLINEYAKQYFGIEESSYLNTPFQGLFLLDEDNREACGLIERALTQERGQTFYNIPLHRNDSESITNIKTHPIFDESFLIGYYIIIEDITEREKLREQVALSEKLASIGLLSAGVAHEINNPLEIIYNYIRYLKFHSRNKNVTRTVNSLEEEINSISQIVSNLITFSDSNKHQVEPVDLNELIDSIINLVKYNAKYKNIQISFKKKNNPILLKANKTEIKQVILNLMKNSFEAMPSGGRLNIETGETNGRDSSLVEITFQDTGGGIKRHNLNDVFLPFYSTKKEMNGNLGLGLSVSYGIVKKYEGTISVRNLNGCGCEFTLRFPQNPGEH